MGAPRGVMERPRSTAAWGRDPAAGGYGGPNRAADYGVFSSATFRWHSAQVARRRRSVPAAKRWSRGRASEERFNDGTIISLPSPTGEGRTAIGAREDGMGTSSPVYATLI